MNMGTNSENQPGLPRVEGFKNDIEAGLETDHQLDRSVDGIANRPSKWAAIMSALIAACSSADSGSHDTAGDVSAETKRTFLEFGDVSLVEKVENNKVRLHTANLVPGKNMTLQFIGKNNDFIDEQVVTIQEGLGNVLEVEFNNQNKPPVEAVYVMDDTGKEIKFDVSGNGNFEGELEEIPPMN